MLKILNNLNIGRRLALAFGVLIILILVDNGISLYIDSLKQQSLARETTSVTAVEVAQELAIQLLQARRREKDFLLRWQSEGFDTAYENYVVLLQQHTQNVRDRVNDLRAITVINQAVSLDTIEQATLEYDRLFIEVVNDLKQGGYVDTGLQGEFRLAARTLEVLPVFVDNLELTATLLQMRRHEKDYLLRPLQEFIDALTTTTQQLEDQVKALPIFESEKRSILQLTTVYLDTFNAVVSIDAKIKTDTDAFLVQSRSIEPLVTIIITEAETQQAAAIADYAQVEATVQSLRLVVLGVLFALAVILTFIVARSITQPVAELVSVTGEIAGGDFSLRTHNPAKDEIGNLGQTINGMADQIQGFIANLEVRTRDLQTVSDVNTQISTILEVDRLLRDVSDLTKERFRLYHSHIYLLNDAGDTLELTAGAGHIGRQMVAEKRRIAYDNPQSIVASAGRTRKGVIINDVRQSPTFLPHPLLPDTRAELAVPLIARGALVGVLDVQSNAAGYFTQDSLSIIELMAGQIAIAISNARLYETSERVSRRERALGTIDRKIQGAISVDEILQTTVRELGKALRVPYTAIELQMTPQSEIVTEEVQI